MNPLRTLPIAGPALLLLIAGLQTASAQQLAPDAELTILQSLPQLHTLVARQPCAIPAPSTGRSGDTIRVDTRAGYPCTFAAAPTGIVLRPSDDGSRPDPRWTSVVRDSRGRYFTAARGASVILVYNADGSFASVLGRAGQGPGELSTVPTMYVGPNDTLFAFHGSNRITVFSPALAFIRDIRGGVSARREALHIAADGRFISGLAPRGAPATGRVSVFAPDGTLQRGIGAIPSTTGPAESRAPDRPVAYSGGATFWTAMAAPARDGYLLEEWTLSGELRRVIYRRATWARSDISDQQTVPGGFPYVRGLSLSPEGILIVTMLVKDASAGSLARQQINDSNEWQFFDVRYEAIDAASGTALASGVLSELPTEGSPAAPPVPFLLPRTHLVYKYEASPDTGLERIVFFEFRLVRK